MVIVPVSMAALTPDADRRLQRLLEVAARRSGHQALNDHQRRVLRLEPAAVVALQAVEEGRLVAHAQAVRDRGGWNVELVVDPGPVPTTAEGVPPAWPEVAANLLGRLFEELARRGGGQVELWVARAGPMSDQLAERAQLVPVRDVVQMRRLLPVPGDAGSRVAVTPFRPGVDDEQWVALNNRSFAGHPDQSSWTLDDLHARMAEPWFDPAGFLLHWHDGRLAASCWTKIHRDVEPPVGEIYVIGVDPDFRGRGLGRALVLCGLDHLWRRGMAEAMLYVDSTNSAATGLYAALGFGLDHVDRCYVGEVAASPPAASPGASAGAASPGGDGALPG